MSISAKIIADSKNEHGQRLTTMMVTFPRFILAELNTHRMFSRNSASSRAIPFKKVVKSVIDNPFIPLAWQKDHSGMQGTEYLQFPATGYCVEKWLEARDRAIEIATYLNETEGLTKQLCNRLLEPFMWHTVLITATEWDNFFKLRCPQYYYEPDNVYFKSRKEWMKCYNTEFSENHDWDSSRDDLWWLSMNKGQAEIHMMALAEAMYDAYNESTPKQLKTGEWHIPFGDDLPEEDTFGFTLNDKIKIAVARCARVSYTVVGEEDKPINLKNDIKLYDRLLVSRHLSPFEHIGKAMSENEYYWSTKAPDTDDFNGWSNNFRGFVQYRKLIEE